MKKLMTLCVLGVAAALNVTAQQKPQYTQYILNQYIINPALTGIENYTDVKLSHRRQWVGVDGAPVTTYFTIQGPINKKDYRTTATSFDVPGENPRGTAYWQNYTAAEPHHGVGLQVVNDKAGPINRFSAMATYAYHIGLSPRTSLAAGFAAGVTNTRLNTSMLDFGNTQIDPAVANGGNINSIKPDFSAGLYLYSGEYFVGLSAQQIIPQDLTFSDNVIRKETGKSVPHIFATAGYRFLIGEDFNLIPSIMVKYVKPSPVQFDVNAKLQYQDRAWIGASYRNGDGYAGMVGINVSNFFNVGYSYDHTTSGLSTVSKGSHEIIIGFLLGNKYDDSCPKNVW
ncbi:PorP/SprF family type IX secretion system membrane protein [Pinibacter aurantiacus]|uniref:Type IX secretion system membrane protein PorP/SprF n=1 Tax=Pinibacter aurantiacus TaxID=2851599 RepID=A0A9E2SAG1_9BACT|nr:type IX secretion system membrane protein PorP/SprF [Pinibacter aurantiacus]MBV4357697.1 type IX secretion system membrane protein PorP/SprF [Pinibacter aurantiacus]